MLAVITAVAAVSTSEYVGSTIALYNVAEQRFMRMGPGDKQTDAPDTCVDMDKSRVIEDPTTMPKTWRWEMFKVVDGGNGTVGLWNTVHKRFVRMPPALGHMDVSIVVDEPKLPGEWEWERFILLPAPDAPGQFGLWHPIHERFVTMNVDVAWLESSRKRVYDVKSTKSWPEERFRLLTVDHLAGKPERGEAAADDADESLFINVADHACPYGFTPEVYALLAALCVVTFISILTAIVAVVWACKQRRGAVAKLSAPMPVAVAPIHPSSGVALMTEAERQRTAI